MLELLSNVQVLLQNDNDGVRTQALRTVEAFATLPGGECGVLVDSALASIKDFLQEPHISAGNIVTGLFAAWRLAKAAPSVQLGFFFRTKKLIKKL